MTTDGGRPRPEALRVVHAYPGNLYGGTEVLIATLARDRPGASGIEATYAVGQDGRLASELRATGAAVQIVGLPRFSRPWTVPATRRRFARVVREVRPRVVVAHGCWSVAVFGPAARRLGVPLVAWIHDRLTGRPWTERLASRVRPDLAIANSRSTLETLVHVFPGVRAEVLYCPVDPPGLADPDGSRLRVRRSMGIGDDDGAVVIVQTSRLEPWKGQTLLIEALTLLADRPGWVAWIAGGAQRPHEQAHLDDLRVRVDRSGLADRVRFLGHRDDIREILAAADVHCQPNLGPEPFGIAFVEALHAGLPVVTTRLGGAVEIVDDATGILVPPGDPPALAEALGRLVDDPGLRARLGSAGPSRARTLSDPGLILARLERLLREVGTG